MHYNRCICHVPFTEHIQTEQTIILLSTELCIFVRFRFIYLSHENCKNITAVRDVKRERAEI